MPDTGELDCPRALQIVGEDGEWADATDFELPSSYAQSTLADAGPLALAEVKRALTRDVQGLAGVCEAASGR
ncbi:hypothetical protein FRC08_016041 [Ceratobasidium sp. 394]|nr:hypothetical protein FRC08_016041 [Ceratobasidium sp. 394]